MVSFAVDQQQLEGNQATVRVTLNGPAVTYPVEVPYTVSGTAEANSSKPMRFSAVLTVGKLSCR